MGCLGRPVDVGLGGHFFGFFIFGAGEGDAGGGRAGGLGLAGGEWGSVLDLFPWDEGAL